MAHCSVQRDRLSVTDAPIVRTFASVGHRSDSLPGIVVKHSRYKFNHHGRSSNYYILLLCRCTQSSYDRPRTSFVDRQCAIPARICRPGNLFASLCSCNCCTRASRNDNMQLRGGHGTDDKLTTRVVRSLALCKLRCRNGIRCQIELDHTVDLNLVDCHN